MPARLLATVAARDVSTVSTASTDSCPSRAPLDARTMPAGTDVVRCGLVGAWYDAGDVMLPVPRPATACRATRNPTFYYCDIRNRTLARGDVLGLRQKY